MNSLRTDVPTDKVRSSAGPGPRVKYLDAGSEEFARISHEQMLEVVTQALERRQV